MSKPPVKVVVIYSVSFTGTTWFALVLASAKGRLAAGNPDRLRQRLSEEPLKTCRVHKEACEFWPRFAHEWDRQENFYHALARFAGVDTIIVSNPRDKKLKAELEAPGLDIRRIRLVRDGRALGASYWRKNPDQDFFGVGSDWLFRAMRDQVGARKGAGSFVIHYEDLVSNPRRAYSKVAEHIDLPIDDSALKFWEFKHHIPSGNGSTHATLRYAQGIDTDSLKNREIYETYINRAQTAGEEIFLDERWKKELGGTERALFDLLCGPSNAALGYERDAFHLAELEDAVARLVAEVKTGGIRPEVLDTVPNNLRDGILACANAGVLTARRAMGWSRALRPGMLRKLRAAVFR